MSAQEDRDIKLITVGIVFGLIIGIGVAALFMAHPEIMTRLSNQPTPNYPSGVNADTTIYQNKNSSTLCANGFSKLQLNFSSIVQQGSYVYLPDGIYCVRLLP